MINGYDNNSSVHQVYARSVPVCVRVSVCVCVRARERVCDSVQNYMWTAVVGDGINVTHVSGRQCSVSVVMSP